MKNTPQILYINPKTSNIKKIRISVTKIIISFLAFLLLTVFALKISSDFMLKSKYSSNFAKLKQENFTVLQQLESMSQTILMLRKQVDDIKSIDDEIRAELDVPALNEDIRQVGVGGSDIEQFTILDIDDPNINSSISNNHLNLARLEREIKLEMESFKTLLYTAEKKKDSLRYLPILKPVPAGRETDGFRKRRHPIIGRVLMHYGQDFGANRGTPIYSPADGRVTYVGKNGAYGLFVTIDHRYGYVTNYGHLQKAHLKKGAIVKRGDIIGEVGNSGRSTAPHLHYEVYYNGKAVNPQDYYFPDIDFD